MINITTNTIDLNSTQKWGYSFIGVTIGILSCLVAPLLFLCIKKKYVKNILPWFSCFGIGVIMTLIVNHNLVEINEVIEWDWKVGTIFLSGFIINYISLYSFKTSNCDDENCDNIKHKHWSLPILIGDGLCNFSDGLIITSSFLGCGIQSGFLITFAVILHEIPHEIGDFSLILDSGIVYKKAVLYNFISASSSYIGWIIANGLDNIEIENIQIYILTF